MEATTKKLLEAIQRETGHEPRRQNGTWECRCPVHEDRRSSLSVSEGDKGAVLHCHAGCETGAIVKAIGLRMTDLFHDTPTNGNGKPKARIVTSYDYHDRDGNLVYQVVRFEPKDFRQRRPDPNRPGEWLWKLNGVRRVLYRLPDVLEAVALDKTVYLVEGERDADNLVKHGLCATCNPGGAGKWRDTYSETLRDARVVILPDNDGAGRKHAKQVARALQGIAREVRVLNLPGLPDKGDVSDWIASGHTTEELQDLAARADLWESDEAKRIDSIEPLRLAEHFLDRRCRRDGALTLRRHNGEWWRFNGVAYEPLVDEALNADLYRHLDGLWFIVTKQDKDIRVDLVPKKTLLAEITAAMPSRGALVAGDMPQWLSKRAGLPDPRQVLLCQNGILDLPTLTLRPTTPEFFSANGLPYAYLADAPEPKEWLAFLRSLWGDDVQSIEALQEWCGYILTPDTRQQKILLLVGPKRGGKGTIGRVLTALIGAQNTCGPTLAGLSAPFGLQPLLEKRLAIVSDARLSGRHDQAVIAERLLSISGEDGITIDRKHMQSVTVTLPTRFMLLTNELPRLTDASGALASRFVVLTLERSFLGHEDHGLTDRLLGELPGILNWSIEGWERLRERGHFAQPESSREAIEELEDLGSPVSVFVRERCQVGAGKTTTPSDLYAAWKEWCRDAGRDHAGTKQTFARDLRAAIPGLRMSQPRVGGTQVRTYEGIAVDRRYE